VEAREQNSLCFLSSRKKSRLTFKKPYAMRAYHICFFSWWNVARHSRNTRGANGLCQSL